MKFISHNALDAAFDYVARRADTLALCCGVPATAEEATMPPEYGGRMLCSTGLIAGLGNGDFAVAPGFGSGRRLIISARDGLEATASGLVDHLVVVSRLLGEVLLITVLREARAVEAGSVVSLTSFSDEIADPM